MSADSTDASYFVLTERMKGKQYSKGWTQIALEATFRPGSGLSRWLGGSMIGMRKWAAALVLSLTCLIVSLPVDAQPIRIDTGMAHYEKLSGELQSAFGQIVEQTEPLGELKPYSLLVVIVGNIKTFRQIDLDLYASELIAYCDKLADRDAKINLEVANNRKLRAQGPTAEQIVEKAAISELRSYCLAPGNSGRQPRYWKVLERLEQKSRTLFDEFQRRLNRCAANTRCKDGVTDG